MKSHRTALAAAVAVAAGLALAPAAGAATVGSRLPCVRVIPGVNSFPVTAAGFPAGATLTFKADGSPVGSGQADAAGSFDNLFEPFPPPSLPFGTNLRTYELTAEDGQGTVAGPVPVPVVRVSVVLPARANPARRVRYRVYGFEAGKPVYLHVRRNGTTRGRFSLGTTAGPCGTLTKRMRFMPLRRYRTGTYGYYFSHSRQFDEDAVIFAGKVSIYRTFRSPEASAQAAATSG